ncbi:MAG: queuosine precursor transporter [Gemmatimonadaceae bacterium]|nr:queuosine precursor transporter [Chitinophagaceae bacterium]
MISYIIKDKSTRLFIILGGFFIANTLIAEVIGVKIFSLEDSLGIQKADFSLLGVEHLSFNLTVGVLPWPIVFIMTDIINEYYGVKGVRFLSLLTAALIGFMFVVFFFAIELVPSDFWIASGAANGVPDMQAAYKQIVGQGMNIIVGSITAFLIGQIADAFVFRKIKKLTGEKRIWARATISTLVSQLIDSYVVIFIAFYIYQDWSLGRVLALATTAYLYKFLVAILCTPVVYGIHWLAERYLGKDLSAQMKKAALEKGE